VLENPLQRLCNLRARCCSASNRLNHVRFRVFAELAKQLRLGGAMFYTWQGQIHAPEEDHDSAVLCGGLTESGRLAVAPM
jgi:hypothetical protein